MVVQAEAQANKVSSEGPCVLTARKCRVWYATIMSQGWAKVSGLSLGELVR